MAFYVYVLGNSEGRLYIGQTSNVELRLRRHNEGKVFWTRSRGPWELLFSASFATRGQAMAHEKKLKAWKSTEAVMRYIAQRQSPDRSGLTARFPDS